MKRLIALVLAYFFLALAIIGAFLPLLPTVPFLLLSAYFAAKGSDKLHQWLLNHRYFGKQLKDWAEQGAISRSSKLLAVSSMCCAWLLLLWLATKTWLLLSLALLFFCVSGFILSRPDPIKEN